MKTPEGVSFCGSCPVKGNCLEVDAERFTVKVVVSKDGDPEGVIKGATAGFIDNDGFGSTRSWLHINGGKVPAPKGEVYQADLGTVSNYLAVAPKVGAILVDRIGRCNGNSVGTDRRDTQYVACPAAGEPVVNALFRQHAPTIISNEIIPS